MLESKVTVLYTYVWQAGRTRERQGKENSLVYVVSLVPQNCVLFLIKLYAPNKQNMCRASTRLQPHISVLERMRCLLC